MQNHQYILRQVSFISASISDSYKFFQGIPRDIFSFKYRAKSEAIYKNILTNFFSLFFDFFNCLSHPHFFVHLILQVDLLKIQITYLPYIHTLLNCSLSRNGDLVKETRVYSETALRSSCNFGVVTVLVLAIAKINEIVTISSVSVIPIFNPEIQKSFLNLSLFLSILSILYLRFPFPIIVFTYIVQSLL